MCTRNFLASSLMCEREKEEEEEEEEQTMACEKREELRRAVLEDQG